MTTTIKAIVSGGRLELNVPADWPEGTEVEIHPLLSNTHSDSDELSAEEIAQTLAAMDRIVPFEMTDAEFAAWEAERRSRKEREKAEFVENAEKLRRMWP